MENIIADWIFLALITGSLALVVLFAAAVAIAEYRDRRR